MTQSLVTKNDYNLVFDKGKEVLTKNGKKWLYTAPPTNTFFDAWRENKEGIKKKGFSLSKFKENWYVNIWTEIPDFKKKEDEKWIKLSKKEKFDKDIQLECPENYQYLNYQKVGIKYALGKKSCLIADEMGLGKTIQAIGVINNDESIKKVLIIAPASLKKKLAKRA